MLSNFFSNVVSPQSVALVTIDLQNLFSRMGGGTQTAQNMVTLLNDVKNVPINRVGVYMDKENEGPEKAEGGFCRVSLGDYDFLHAKSDLDAMASLHSTNDDLTLEKRLNDLGVTHIAMGGYYTNWCVEASALTARTMEFKVAVLTDCVHDFFEKGDAGIQRMSDEGVIMMDSTSFIQGLSQNFSQDLRLSA